MRPSITDTDDLADGGTVFHCSDHEVGYIRTRNSEAETGQVTFAYAILARARLVCEFGRAHDGPVERASIDNLLHGVRVGNCHGEKQATEKIGWWNDRVFEEEGHRLNRYSLDPNLQHGARERDREAFQEMRFRFRYRITRTECRQNRSEERRVGKECRYRW